MDTTDNPYVPLSSDPVKSTLPKNRNWAWEIFSLAAMGCIVGEPIVVNAIVANDSVAKSKPLTRPLVE